MGTASQCLRDVVGRMVDEDANLDTEAGLLVLAALEDDVALATELGGGGKAQEPLPPPGGAPTTAASYLASITVEGFRGIGEQAVLDVHPGPGLTVVAGRNGSGKSSFAEAAELAVTGGNRRWDDKASAWREGWRNLHRPDPVCIRIEMVGDGSSVTLTRAWTADDPLDGGTWTRQVHGEKLEPLVGPGSACTTYRPFLSYNELGSVIDAKPSAMYDALHTLLGLDDLTVAERRLATARKERDDRAKAARETSKALLGRLEQVDDDRASRAIGLLRARVVDVDALGDLALGTDDDATTLSRLQAVAALDLPAPNIVEKAARELRSAGDAVAAVSSDQARASADLAKLLRTALAHHAAHGDGQCPVCGAATLDAAWYRDADRRAAEAEQGARDLDAAQRRVTAASGALTLLATPPPAVLDAAQPVDTTGVRDAWTRRHEALHDTDSSSAVLDADRALRPLLASVVAAARAELERRDESWRPLATGLVGLHEQLVRVAGEGRNLMLLKKAEAWLKEAASRVRNERMAPLAQRSQEIWADLRQQSNVALGPVRLEGSATRRKATLDVTVDDVEGAALGVMSQGELHSLALSLFLPRASLDESPFRYVLIDDPVQAMDPAKVDGLVQVLSTVACDRQVIVFSHDDRLAESVRRARIPARIVEVLRRDRSIVSLRESDDPVVRHLGDAHALVRSNHVPEDLRREIVASYCRSALEAAAHAAFRRSRLRAGDDRADVEHRLGKAHTLHQVLTLAVFNDVDRHGDLFGRLRSAGPRARDTVDACKRGAHRGFHGDLAGLVTDTKSLCGWVERQ